MTGLIIDNFAGGGGAMRYLSICSGIEAASTAWHPLGWQCAGVSEIEAFPRAVLEQRLGAVAVDWDHRHTPQSNMIPLFGDFTRIEPHHVGPIDLLVGGTPCQSFSVAGKRLGLDDPRGHLTLEFLALARRLRPRWLVWENVPGVLSDDEGRTLGTFLRLLGECGYGWAYRVLDAQYVRVAGFGRAVPQRRRRVFVVGYLGDSARAAAVLFDRESLRGNPAPRREAGQGVAADVAPSLVSSGRGVERCGETRGQDPVIAVADVAPTLNAHFGDKLGLEDQHINGGGDCLLPPVSMCLNAGQMGRRDAETETLIPTTGAVFDVAHSLRANGFDASEDGTGRGTPIVPVYGLSTQQEPKWAEDVSPTLARPSISGGGQVTAIAHAIQAGALRENPNSGPDGVGVQEGIAYTLEARSEVQAIAASWAVRRLTPTECERLMGFPDDHTLITYRGKPAADGPRYKAIGNSMAVNVMRFIGERIAAVDAATAQKAAA